MDGVPAGGDKGGGHGRRGSLLVGDEPKPVVMVPRLNPVDRTPAQTAMNPSQSTQSWDFPFCSSNPIYVRGRVMESGSAEQSYSRILVPLDGSRLSEIIVPYAQAFAKTLRLPVELLQVVAPEAVKLLPGPSGSLRMP